MKATLSKASDDQWKELCIKNFDFISMQLTTNKNPKMSAAQLAIQNDYEEIRFMDLQKKEIVEREDNLNIELKQRQLSKKKELESYSLSKDYDEKTFGFKQLYLKLVFESLINDLFISHDFGMIYEFIKEFSKELTSIKLRVQDKTSLKSNHYWLMGIIPKLQHMKSLTIYKQGQQGSLQQDFFKFLQKALAYFKKNGCSLDKFALNNIHYYNTSITGDILFGCLKSIPDVRVLDFYKTPIS